VSTAEILITQYGPLLTLAQLAKILDRSAEGLRISLRFLRSHRAVKLYNSPNAIYRL
jgi:hypothetical protein